MKIKNRIKLAVDFLLTLVLLLLMAFPVTGQAAHEWLGLAMLALFAVHHFLNRQWAQNLLKGKYNAWRITQTAIDIMLLAAMLILILSGISLSRYALPSAPAFLSAALSRQLHLSVSHWAFLLMSVHLGLHWQMIAARLPKTRITVLPWLLAGLIGAYGLWALWRRQIWLYLLGTAEFLIFDGQYGGILFFLDYLGIMGLAAGITYGAVKICRS